jgi:class 3 adenylate cyclase
MTIRRRLGLSFLAILVLFATNQAIYFWSAGLRKATMESLNRALGREAILDSIQRELDSSNKQIALLNQLQEDAGGPGSTTEARQLFSQKLDRIAQLIVELRPLTDSPNSSSVNDLDDTFRKLADHWRGFYQFWGVNQGFALAESVRADPLAKHLLAELLPNLQEKEKQRVRDAQAMFEQAAWRTDVTAIGIFLLSVLVAAFVAYRVSRHLTESLGELKLGAAFIGSGDFEHRIATRGNDELTDLAHSFNDMGENLHIVHAQLTQAKDEVDRRNTDLEKQRALADSLLLNILPYQIAIELQTKGVVDPRYFEDATILFSDFVGFTKSTENLAAEDLVHLLHDYFTAFDQIVTRYHLEKLKTIGDSYMCVGGLPVDRRSRRTPSHPVDTLLAAFEMIRAVADRDRPDRQANWAVRIGIHTGPVIAGVVGIQKFAFDIWGDSVNFSSRLESAGASNRINISAGTHARIKDFFQCEHRGKVRTKEEKEFDMYFVNGLLPELVDSLTEIPPPAFLRRYRVYFQKDPPAFPAFLLDPLRPAPG